MEALARVGAIGGGVSSEAAMGFYSGYPTEMKLKTTQKEVIVK